MQANGTYEIDWNLQQVADFAYPPPFSLSSFRPLKSGREWAPNLHRANQLFILRKW